MTRKLQPCLPFDERFNQPDDVEFGMGTKRASNSASARIAKPRAPATDIPVPFTHSCDGCSIIVGNSRDVLARFPANRIQSCITSPPYWGLRDYGIADQIGAEMDLDRYIDDVTAVFREVRRVLREDGTLWLNIGDAYTSGNRTCGKCWN